jgi:hypothetical protein
MALPMPVLLNKAGRDVFSIQNIPSQKKHIPFSPWKTRLAIDIILRKKYIQCTIPLSVDIMGTISI